MFKKPSLSNKFKKSSSLVNKDTGLVQEEIGKNIVEKEDDIHYFDDNEETTKDYKESKNLLESKKLNSRHVLKFSNKEIINKSEQIPQQNNKKNNESFKKEFISEKILLEAKSKEELDKIYGKEKENYQILKEQKKHQIDEYIKEKLFSIPDNLKIEEIKVEDSVEHLLKLSQTGLVEVPLPIEDRLKTLKATEEEFKNKSLLDFKVVEEVDLLKNFHTGGSSFSQGLDNELNFRKQQKVDMTFKDVFSSFNGRKRRLLKDENQIKNKLLEE